MKISIITATLNNKAGLVRAIESVCSQTYKNVEHIIVDGGSTDGSVELIKNEKLKIKNLEFISEPDSGIYDAINKGIKLATGDIIGLLHSDDYYKDNVVLEKYAAAFTQSAESKAHSEVDAVYSDLVYVRSEKREVRSNDTIFKDNEHSIIRYWKAGDLSSSLRMTKWLENGWMPPHPTLFVKKIVFEKYGLYRTDMKIASDYEMVLRLFFKNNITSKYLPLTTYCMSIGGASNKSIKNILLKSKEDLRSMKMNELPHPIKTLIFKNLSKISQFINR